MCEPYHSVVQYPDDFNDDDLPFGGQMDKESRLKSALGKAFDWSRKIGKWFHLSKFGAGHSKASGEVSRSSIYLPRPTLYEGMWWDRKFVLDGYGYYITDQEALKAAECYHKSSVMGNMKMFRRFLETSMVKTIHPRGPYAYVEKLIENVWTAEGVNKLLEKFRRVFGRNAHPNRIMGYRGTQQPKEKAIKIVMGFTRKRGLFLPHFADDNSLWLPGSGVGDS